MSFDMRNAVSASHMVKANAATTSGIMTPEEHAQEAEIQREVYAGVNFLANRGPDADKREALAETVFEVLLTLEQKRAKPDVVDMMFEKKPGQYGKIVRVKRFYGAQVFARAYGGYKRRSTIQSAAYTISTEPSAVVIEIAVEELKSGMITASDIAVMMDEAVMRYKADLAWTTWQTALAQGGAYCDTFTGDIAQTELDTVLEEVADQTEVGAIIGRRIRLSPIVGYSGYDNATGYPESVKDEIHRTGFMGQYAGVPLVSIKSWTDEQHASAAVIPTTDIFIMPKDLSICRFVEVGGVQKSSDIDKDTNNMMFYVDLEDGAAVFLPQYARRLLRTGA
ncbi:MAG TPA: hypothetical protein VMY37_31870 [Thermoguttaceae bacterium]|nr:hypothetical protein [Thermoguttaceae bacterium]